VLLRRTKNLNISPRTLSATILDSISILRLGRRGRWIQILMQPSGKHNKCVYIYIPQSPSHNGRYVSYEYILTFQSSTLTSKNRFRKQSHGESYVKSQPPTPQLKKIRQICAHRRATPSSLYNARQRNVCTMRKLRQKFSRAVFRPIGRGRCRGISSEVGDDGLHRQRERPLRCCRVRGVGPEDLEH
jgi:hypothetical protein